MSALVPNESIINVFGSGLRSNTHNWQKYTDSKMNFTLFTLLLLLCVGSPNSGGQLVRKNRGVIARRASSSTAQRNDTTETRSDDENGQGDAPSSDVLDDCDRHYNAA